MKDVKSQLIEGLEERGIKPVLGLHISKLLGDAKDEWVQYTRKRMKDYYLNDGRISLECELGPDIGSRRAEDYTFAYDAMTDDQVISSYIREANIIKQELRAESKFLERCEKSARRIGKGVTIK